MAGMSMAAQKASRKELREAENTPVAVYTIEIAALEMVLMSMNR